MYTSRLSGHVDAPRAGGCRPGCALHAFDALVLMAHEGIPDAVPAADQETGTRMTLANLARLVETDRSS
ncbi:hypothetical protein GCM10010104_63190 [Streptomyces indiaensis]|uniref:Uncharacterized protein n=1 Tax=Streptomyces indiaensis TaxID=284033 RepID=A0ABP5RFU4_9ACTN